MHTIVAISEATAMVETTLRTCSTRVANKYLRLNVLFYGYYEDKKLSKLAKSENLYHNVLRVDKSRWSYSNEMVGIRVC